MRVDFEHLLDNEIKKADGLEEIAEVCYPTGCVDMTKKEILAKMCEIEFRISGTWSHEFLDDLELKYQYMNACDLAGEMCKRLQEIFDWDESIYARMLG